MTERTQNINIFPVDAASLDGTILLDAPGYVIGPIGIAKDKCGVNFLRIFQTLEHPPAELDRNLVVIASCGKCGGMPTTTFDHVARVWSEPTKLAECTDSETSL